MPDTQLTTVPQDPTREQTATFEFTCAPGPCLFECSLDGQVFTLCGSPHTVDALSSGIHDFTVRAVSQDGLADPSPASFTWEVDASPPSVTLTQTPTNPSGQQDDTVAFTCDEAGCTYLCTVDGGAEATCVSPLALTALTAGEHTVTVVAVDAVGNRSSPETVVWVVDLELPDTLLISGPPAATNVTTWNVEFDCSEAGCTFECSLDAAAPAPCTSPQTLRDLEDGQHVFEVYALDQTGNVDPSPLQVTFTVDTVGPGVTVTSGPSNPVGSSTAQFTFTCSEDPCGFECNLDGAGFTACTSPQAYGNVVDGNHAFQVRATDAAGNVSGLADHSWRVDTDAPNVAFVSAPQDPNGFDTAVFAFTCDEAPCTLECRLDSGAFELCVSPHSVSGLSQGPHLFEVRATDEAGNPDPSPAQHAWNVDLQVPDTLITVFPPTPDNHTSVSVEFTCSKSGCTFRCSLDGAAPADCISPQNLTALADGEHVFTVAATDSVGNADTTPAEYRWFVDTARPETSIASGPPALTNATAASFTFSCDEGSCSFECSLDLGAFSACTSPKSYSGLSEGEHTFEVRATDAATNTDATAALHTWTIDRTPPNTSITSGPLDPTNLDSAAFTFSSSETSSFECSLDGAAFAPCSSPASYSALPGGSHNFLVRAVDVAGNIDGSPASFTWNIDRVPPDTSVSTHPLNPTNQGAANFTFTSTETGSAFECQLDNGGFSSCASPRSYTVTEGAHTFEVRAIDPAGNPDPSPASFSWVVDQSPPDTSITAQPNNPTNLSTASFTFSATEGGGTFECQLDGTGFTACTSPRNFAGLSASSHTFQVRAIDPAGNTDASAATFTWVIDQTPPDTSITAQPNNPTNQTAATFSFTSTEGGTFECDLDGGGFAACTSPRTYSGLSESTHVFSVRATDPAGNTDASAATFTWVVDRTPPDTSITAQPNNPTNQTSATLSFSATETGSTFECDLDGGGFSSCTAPRSYSGLSVGSHTFSVRGTDPAGNTDASPATFTWVIDQTPPDTNITAQPNNPTNLSSASFSFSATETGSTFECQLDGGGFTTCASPRDFTGLSATSHTFQVRAIDPAGNTDASAATFTWVIDQSPPDTSITAQPNNPTNQTSATFSFTSTEGGTFECDLDGGGFAACTSPRTYSGLSESTHVFSVRATDPAGNTDASAATFTWVVDRTPPDTSITAQPNNPTNQTSASFSFSATETGSSFECDLDGTGFSSCTAPRSYSGLSVGSHTFSVRGTDPAGNTDASPATFTWVIDQTPPDTNITAQPNNPTNLTSASFSFSATETGSTFECQLDGGGFSACTSPRTFSGLSAASHAFEVRATDPAGNVDTSPASYTWVIDQSPPDTNITGQPNNPTNQTSATFTFTSTETGSSFECELDAGGFTPCASPRDFTGLGESTHTFRVRATDPAGNTDTSAASFTWTVDRTPPDTNITAQPNNPTNQTSASFTFTATETGSTFECELDGGGFSTCSSPHAFSGLSESTHTFRVRATDPAGNTDAADATFTWVIDTTPPSTTISGTPADPTNQTSATFTFDASETGCTFECQLDAAGFGPCTSPITFTSLPAGSHMFDVRATDPVGNTDLVMASFSWVIDLTPPETTLIEQPGNPTNITNANFGFTSNEGGSTFECELDFGGFFTCSNPRLYGGLSEATHNFRVRATDSVGNVDPTPAVYSWVVDLTPPDTVMDSTPAHPTNATAATFAFHATEVGSTFDCRLDAATFAPCSSPHTLAGLSDGSHVFHVRAVDPAGNPDTTESTFSWTIDTAGPVITINDGPQDPTSVNLAVFLFSADEGVSGYECAFDAGGFTVCDSGQTYNNISEGTHTFQVRATDTLGNQGSPTSYTWRTDYTAPTVTIDSAPNNPTNSTAPSFQFTCSESGCSFMCRLDSGSFASCTSPTSYSGQTAGSHTFRVYATDAVGLSGVETVYTWTIDLTAPNTAIVSGPTNPTNDTTPTITFNSPDDPTATFECCYNNCPITGPYTPCTSPYQITEGNTVEGFNRLRVRAVDPAGNVDATPTSSAWTQDTIAPVTQITVTPPSSSTSTSSTFNFRAVSGETCNATCQIDGGSPYTCTSGAAIYLLDGFHTFSVYCTDSAGNVDVTPETYSWTIDTTPPVTTITSAPAKVSSDTNISISFVCSEAACTFQCSLDGASFSTCTSPYTATVTAASHSFQVRATDAFGTVSAFDTKHTWTNPFNVAALGKGSLATQTCVTSDTGAVKCWGGTPSEPVMPETATQVAKGLYHQCALGTSGKVYCWGTGNRGALGLGNYNSQTNPQEVTALTALGTATAVSTGYEHSCARLSTGVVYCWGDNTSGQLGNGTFTASNTPVQVSSLTNADTVTVGGFHTCARRSDGTAACWGEGGSGQLGNSAGTDSNVPVTVATLTAVDQISAGGSHTCAHDTANGGKVFCWGSNFYMQLGQGAGNTNPQYSPAEVTGVGAATYVTAGFSHTCAILSNGDISCFGSNGYGQLGDGSTTSSGVPLTVSGLSNVVEIVAGYDFTIARTASSVRAWGQNSGGQMGNGYFGSSYVPAPVAGSAGAAGADLSCGSQHCCFASGGNVYCSGENSAGALGQNFTDARRAVPVQVSGLSNVVKVSVGVSHSCALTSGGAMYCWGSGIYGQLGDGQGTNSATPVQPNGLSSGVVDISCGQNHTCAVLSSGDVKCWGQDTNHQLGNGGTTVDVLAADAFLAGVLNISGAVGVSAGYAHTCAWTSSGAVKCWGLNTSGQLGTNDTFNWSNAQTATGLTSGYTHVSAGFDHTCATDGVNIKCWGGNTYRQLGVGSTNSTVLTPASVLTFPDGVLDLSAFALGTCMTTLAHDTYCWGYGETGNLGYGGSVNRSFPTPVTTNLVFDQLGHGQGAPGGIDTDFNVATWGYDSSGATGTGRGFSVTPSSILGLP
ncbi:MAG: hypothetical protein AB2A00_31155 [Myxococcota bacterium]